MDHITASLTKKEKLADQVAHRIRKQILSGQLKRGQHLNESSIAVELGVSRSPVRDAIKTLESEGLLETPSTGRTEVVGFNAQDLGNLYDLRFDLEWTALKPLHKKGVLSFEQITEIEALLQKMEKIEEATDEMRTYDIIFHRMLVEASGNRPLIRMWSTMIQTIDALQEITNEEISHEYLKDVIDVHRRIFKSILEGNVNQTKLLFKQHIESGLNIVIQILKDNIAKKDYTLTP